MLRRASLSGLVFVLASLPGGSSRAKPGDAEDLRQKATAMKAEAARMAEIGRRDDAERLVMIADAMTTLADRSDPDARFAADAPGSEVGSLNVLLHERVKRLHEIERRIRNPNGDPSVRGLRVQIDDIKREIARLESERQRSGRAEQAAWRVRHMRVAAGHLQDAGVLDLAGQVLLKAAAMEAEAAGPPPAEEVRELRREIERFGAELDEVRKQVKPK